MRTATVFLCGVLVVMLLCAGCTRSSDVKPELPPVTGTPVPVETGTVPVTTEATTAPVVTIIHQISQTKEIKDSELLFALKVPVEWDVSTTLLENTGGSEGLTYETSLVRDRFSIFTYTASRSQDQAYRDLFRTWSPAPQETTVTINGITYDRFESAGTGGTRVGYVARKASANERGYASVLLFTADTASRFEKEDFENVVSSFRYFSAHAGDTVPGEEIRRVSIPDSSGSALSRTAPGGSAATGSGGCSRCGT